MMESPKALPSFATKRRYPSSNTATAPTHSNVGLRLRLIQPTLAEHFRRGGPASHDRGTAHHLPYDGIAGGASIRYRELAASTAQRRNGTAHLNVGLRLRLIQPTWLGTRYGGPLSYDGIAGGASVGYRELTAPTAQRRNGTAHLNVGLRLRLIQPTMAGHPVRRTAFRRMESPEALTSVTTKWLHTPSNVETAPTHLTSEYAGLTVHRGTADRFRRMESAKALPSFTANRGTSPVNDPAYTSGSFKRRRGKDA